jgi:ankyrin repeat protein
MPKLMYNHQTNLGLTGHHYACRNGHMECVGLLIASEANVQLQTKYCDTRLTDAAWKGHLECLKLMIDAKADINYQNPDGHNALSLAVRFGHLSSLYALFDQPSNIAASAHVKSVAL